MHSLVHFLYAHLSSFSLLVGPKQLVLVPKGNENKHEEDAGKDIATSEKLGDPSLTSSLVFALSKCPRTIRQNKIQKRYEEMR